MNSAFAEAAVSCFTTKIQRVRDKVGKSTCPPNQSVGNPAKDEEAKEKGPRSKRVRHSNNQFIREAKKVYDVVITQYKTRF